MDSHLPLPQGGGRAAAEDAAPGAPTPTCAELSQAGGKVRWSCRAPSCSSCSSVGPPGLHHTACPVSGVTLPPALQASSPEFCVSHRTFTMACLFPRVSVVTSDISSQEQQQNCALRKKFKAMENWGVGFRGIKSLQVGDKTNLDTLYDLPKGVPSRRN